MKCAALLACVLISACRDSAEEWKGEVRGMSEAMTAYSKAIQVSDSVADSSINYYCASLERALVAVDTVRKRSDVYRLIRAEAEREAMKNCPSLKVDAYCGFGDMVMIEGGLKVAQEGDEEDVPAPMVKLGRVFRQRAAQIVADREARANELANKLAGAAADTLRATLIKHADVVVRMDRDGSFRLRPKAGTKRLVLLVDRDKSAAMASMRASESPVIVPYDSTTFDARLQCRH
jgi:hypothetical protein